MEPNKYQMNQDVKYIANTENTIGSNVLMTFDHHQNIRSVENDAVEPIQDRKDNYRRNSVTAKNGRGING